MPVEQPVIKIDFWFIVSFYAADTILDRWQFAPFPPVGLRISPSFCMFAAIEPNFPAIESNAIDIWHLFRFWVHSTYMKYGILSSVLVAAGLGLAAPQVLAQAPGNPTSLGSSGDWEAFTYEAEGSKVCYVYSQPKKSDPAAAKRGPIYFMITHWPSKKVKAQPSTFIGYTFKEGSEVKLAVDAKSFNLYPVDNMAWTDKLETEKSILVAMKSGKSMTISGTSAKGTATKDTYSLSGISAAMDAIDGACK
jgi:Invasion associated locus B (IalB) protein